MEIKQFENQNRKKIMLLHGNLMCWRQFEDIIPLLEKDFMVYAVSFDGFDGTDTTTYTTARGMQTMMSRIPDNISLESVRATWEAGLYLYRSDFPVQPDANVACWYGEKEGHMNKAVQRLKKSYPKLTLCCFNGFGHGDIINHPELLVKKLKSELSRK